MKKHSGNVVYAGLFTGIFGLLLMGGVTAATSLFLQASTADVVSGIVQGASGLSLSLIFLGVLLFGFGLFMRTWSD